MSGPWTKPAWMLEQHRGCAGPLRGPRARQHLQQIKFMMVPRPRSACRRPRHQYLTDPSTIDRRVNGKSIPYKQ